MFSFDNSYARLPQNFHRPARPAAARAPTLIRFNHALAEELGIASSDEDTARLAQVFGGQVIPIGAEPLAQAYAGHQFGHFNPQLGDGRALLLGEVIDRDGRRRDIQLKGSGPTVFSRNGDGMAALGPVLREYIVSEAFAALGVPATRALAAVATGEQVVRETMLPGAVFTRVAASHIRVGTFQFFAAQGDEQAVQTLADYVIDRHYAEARQAENPYLAMLTSVAERQAKLIARWLSIGFIHGVMNTDNMAISGEPSISAPAPSSTNMIRARSFLPSISAAATPMPTSRASASGISPGLPSACCRFSILTRRRHSKRQTAC